MTLERLWVCIEQLSERLAIVRNQPIVKHWSERFYLILQNLKYLYNHIFSALNECPSLEKCDI